MSKLKPCPFFGMPEYVKISDAMVNKTISQIKALVIESLGERKHTLSDCIECSSSSPRLCNIAIKTDGYNQKITEMKEKFV